MVSIDAVLKADNRYIFFSSNCIKVSKLRKGVEGGLKIEIFCVLFILCDVYLSKREEKSSQKEKNQSTLRNKHEIQKKGNNLRYKSKI